MAAVGSVDDAALPSVVQQARTLTAHAQKLGQLSGGGGGGGGGGVAASQPGGSAAGAAAAEFGAGLDFRPPRSYVSADEAVLAMCGAGSGSAAPGQPR